MKINCVRAAELKDFRTGPQRLDVDCLFFAELWRFDKAEMLTYFLHLPLLLFTALYCPLLFLPSFIIEWNYFFLHPLAFCILYSAAAFGILVFFDGGDGVGVVKRRKDELLATEHENLALDDSEPLIEASAYSTAPRSRFRKGITKVQRVMRHYRLMQVTFMMILLGMVVVEYAKFSRNKYHFQSWHSLISIVTVSVLLLQYLGGWMMRFRYSFARSWIPAQINAKVVWRIHRFAGVAIMTALFAAMVSGFFSHWMDKQLSRVHRLLLVPELLMWWSGVVLMTLMWFSSLFPLLKFKTLKVRARTPIDAQFNQLGPCTPFVLFGVEPFLSWQCK